MEKHANKRQPGDERRNVLRRVTWLGLFLNLLLAGMKLVAGLLAGSHALVADAVHSISDMVTDVAILLGETWWSQPADKEHPYGHSQLEAFVTILIGGVLVAAALGIGGNAIMAVISGGYGVPGRWALPVALISMLLKEAMYHLTVAAGRRIDSLPLVANAWHHRSDALSSLPVVLALGGIQLHPQFAFLDPLGGVVVCLFLLFAAYRIAWPAFVKMLGAGATEAVVRDIQATALSHQAVKEVHRVRTRYLGCSRIAVDLHVLVDGGIQVREGHAISEQVKEMIIAGHSRVADVVVHLEPYG